MKVSIDGFVKRSIPLGGAKDQRYALIFLCCFAGKSFHGVDLKIQTILWIV
jgi:hypothetical protein